MIDFEKKPRIARLFEIDYTRAFAIVMVVTRHYRVEPMPDIWADVLKLISSNMPLFLSLSGFLFMYTAKPGETYSGLLMRKVRRLLIPYLFTSLIVITIKLLMQQFTTHVDNPVTVMSYVSIFYSPSAGYYLWFIWTVWWMFVIAPWFRSRKAMIALFVITLVASNLPWHITEIFCLDETRVNAVYFVAGMLMYGFRKYFLTNSTAVMLAAVACLVVLEVGVYFDSRIALKLVPFVAIFTIPAVFRALLPYISERASRVLMQLAAASYIIYLFHTTFEGFAKALLSGYAAMGGWYYIASALLSIAAGVLIPFVLYTSVLKRYKVTRFMFGL